MWQRRWIRVLELPFLNTWFLETELGFYVLKIGSCQNGEVLPLYVNLRSEASATESLLAGCLTCTGADASDSMYQILKVCN